ncbi:MAG: hypothetical protein DWG76_03175 [Chloroflexi bacterium]|nr:hypothetical protein [Chloroflexota bacterium]
MTTENSLKQLRRKAYLAYHQDGILDIVIGLAIIGFGLMMLSNSLVVFSWLPALLYMPLKNAITVPRFGFVQFDSEVRTKTQLARGLAIGVLTISVFVGLYFAVGRDSIPAVLRNWVGENFMLVLGGFGAVMLIGTARLVSLQRLYWYAGAMLGIIYLGIRLDIAEPVYTITLGLLFLIPGVWMLIRFLQKYPRTGEGNAEG